MPWQEEYLLNATSALGVFAQVKCGASLRPPLQWSNNVTHVVFTHPYILTLNDEFITVHRCAALGLFLSSSWCVCAFWYVLELGLGCFFKN